VVALVQGTARRFLWLTFLRISKCSDPRSPLAKPLVFTILGIMPVVSGEIGEELTVALIRAKRTAALGNNDK
jgi:hypothetical protein